MSPLTSGDDCRNIVVADYEKLEPGWSSRPFYVDGLDLIHELRERLPTLAILYLPMTDGLRPSWSCSYPLTYPSCASRSPPTSRAQQHDPCWSRNLPWTASRDNPGFNAS
jgi:hypothetical protein